MMRAVSMTALLSLCFTASADCTKIDAVFEDTSAGKVLSVLASEAGYALQNPELATARMNAVFENEDPARLLAKVAWAEGFELRIRGSELWLEKEGSEAPGS